jgi:glycosyltransferase involved in cell wall biosynthesis
MKISIIIPCYNAGGYIEETMESVLGQGGDFGPFSFFIPNRYKGRLNGKNIYYARGQWIKKTS